MIATNIEQSKQLLELGISPYTVDMFWLVTSEPHLHILDNEPLSNYDRWEHYPAWSLYALLKLIQKKGIIIALRNSMLNQQWSVSCDIDDIWKQCKGDTPIDAAFEMVCWLKENKYI